MACMANPQNHSKSTHERGGKSYKVSPANVRHQRNKERKRGLCENIENQETNSPKENKENKNSLQSAHPSNELQYHKYAMG